MTARATISATVLVLLAGAASAWAGDPVPGTYYPFEDGGDVFYGTISQSWEQPLNGMNGAGDVLCAWASVPGPTKCGSPPPCDEWGFQCGVQPGPQTVVDGRDGGSTGAVVTTNEFMGGTFFLHRSGPWGDGVTTLTGTFEDTRLVRTENYVGGVLQDAQFTLVAHGSFDGSSYLLTFTVAEGTIVGDTDHGPWPTSYPDLLSTGCEPTRTAGWWGDLHRVTLVIELPTPAWPSSWGRVKTFYR